MYMTMCRQCAAKMMDKYRMIEVEGSETIGRCEQCQYISRGDKRLTQYEIIPRYRQRRQAPAAPAWPKDNRAKYKDPWRADF